MNHPDKMKIMNKTNQHSTKGLFLLLYLLGCFSVVAQEGEITGELANWVTDDSRPGWIELNEDANFSQKGFLNLLEEGDSFAEASTFELDNSTRDAQGKSRHVYQQYYKGIPIENHLFLIHEDQNRIFLAQGRFVNTPKDPDTTPLMLEPQALIRALDAASASQYAWEVPSLEQNLQAVNQDPTATYYPKGTLVWVEGGVKGALELAWKFDIYAVEPLTRKEYFINAKTGLLVRTIDLISTGCFDTNHKHHSHNIGVYSERNHSENASRTLSSGSTKPSIKSIEAKKTSAFNQTFAGAAGTGIANYITAQGGVVSMTTDLDTIGTPDTFKLRTIQYGPNPLDSQVIRTMNANNIWSYNYLTDFTDVDNVWDTDPAAVGAHWGAQKSFDYFWEEHGRKSFDNNRFTMVVV